MNEATKLWVIIRSRSFEKDLAYVDYQYSKKIEDHINSLQYDPYYKGCQKLQGRENEWAKRFGDYRVIHHIQKKPGIVQLIKVERRKKAY